jgi:uncharacterized repeat protein (TIGR04138 family)
MTQHPLVELLAEDPRYSFEAYQFVREALSYGQQVLGYGEERPADDDEMPANPFLAALAEEARQFAEDDDDDEPRVERHVTGQQLCEAIRQHALDQYGYMAKVVLNRWGVTSTSDFGEIVYNLIRLGWMKKSDGDRREDFDNCYDFSEAFEQQFEFTAPSE